MNFGHFCLVGRILEALRSISVGGSDVEFDYPSMIGLKIIPFPRFYRGADSQISFVEIR